MRLLRIFPLLCLVLLLVPAQAQPVPLDGWQVVLYDEPANTNGGQLIYLNPEGIQDTRTLPDVLYGAPYTNGYVIDDMKMSPNRRFVVVTYKGTVPTAAPQGPVIADLISLRAVTISLPVGFPVEANIGGFSPDGSRVAIGYLGATNELAPPDQGGVVAVDLEYGRIEGSLTMTEANEAIDNPNPDPYAFVGYWYEDGIRFTPTCYSCGLVVEKPYYIWNPEEDTVTESDERYNVTASRLPLTGEMLFTRRDEGLPAAPTNGPLEPLNSVKYFPTAETAEEGLLVYYSRATLDLYGAYWVLDGNGFVTQNRDGSGSIVTLRDGSQISAFMPQLNFAPAIGTPDGWVTIDADGGVEIWRVQAGEATSRNVATVRRNPNLSTFIIPYSTPLGSSVTTPGEFTGVTFSDQHGALLV